MKEPKFVNQYAFTKDVYREIYFSQPARKAPYLVMVGFGALFTALLAVGYFRFHDSSMLWMILFIWGLFAAVCACLRYLDGMMVKRITGQMQRLGNGAAPEFVYRVGHDFTCTSPTDGSEQRYAPEQIRSVRETERLFLLRTKAKQILALKKDGFTQGSCEEFRNFLRQRYPKAKLRS